MKITHVEAIPVRVPRPQPFQSSLGTHQASENAVVLIHTDTGLTGLGEASSIWDRRGRGESEAINGLLADMLCGLDPRRIREIADRMNQVLHRSFPAKAGIEMALYDLVGKACGVPVYQLLGGQVRDRVLLSHSLSMGDPEAIAAQAQSLVAQGYKTLKAKIGRDLHADLAVLAAVRNAVGSEVTLRVDANMGWSSAKEAVRSIEAIADFDLELVEQPLAADDLEGLRFVRERVSLPIMADESVGRRPTPSTASATKLSMCSTCTCRKLAAWEQPRTSSPLPKRRACPVSSAVCPSWESAPRPKPTSPLPCPTWATPAT